MTAIQTMIRRNSLTLRKTGSYYAMHIMVAASVAYVVTGNWLAALTLSLLEPSVQAVAFFFHERAWQRVAQREAGAAGALPATAQRVPAG